MAAKKTKTKRKSADAAVRKKIAAVVEQLPSVLIIEAPLPAPVVVAEKEMSRPDDHTVDGDTPQVTDEDRALIKKKQFILRAGVVIFSGLVFVMWLVNTKSFIRDAVRAPSAERMLWEKARLDTGEIMKKVDEKSTVNDLLPKTDNVRAALGEVIAGLSAMVPPAAATTASSTTGSSTTPFDL